MSVGLVDPWPYVRQAVIRTLRSNLVLKDGLLGDWSEGVAPKSTPFPHGVIQLHYAPVERDWSGFMAVLGFDAVIFSKTKDEADSLAQLVFGSLNNVRLDPDEQSSLQCRFVSTISIVDAAPDGTDTVYESGAIYVALAPQSNPSNRTLTVTMDSTIG
jgi:hypothetical protein